jgi:formylmethanofuran dehydrogenase subunit E
MNGHISMTNKIPSIPEDLARCVEFHGHLCPGLVYGYLIAKEAMRRMNLERSGDEEIVAVCENDSCAVDALQVLLGTSLGKGNLIFRDFGKNAFTVLSRAKKKAYRFVRKVHYEYSGNDKKTFERLDAAATDGTASESDQGLLKQLKVEDLLQRDFKEIFTTTEIPYEEPRYAPIEPSEPCVLCGEMTMISKMLAAPEGLICIPCSQKR